MNIRMKVRTLVAASLLAVAVVGVSAGAADAKPKKPLDDGVRCAVTEPTTGEIEFYLPGEVVTVMDSNGVGHRVQCGADGTWIRLFRAPKTGVRPMNPLPLAVAP